MSRELCEQRRPLDALRPQRLNLRRLLPPIEPPVPRPRGLVIRLPPPRFDLAGIAARLLERADVLVPQWLPNGRRAGHEWFVGSLVGERGRSLKVNLRTGRWRDFGSDEAGGGDLVSLNAALHGLRQAEAARELERVAA